MSALERRLGKVERHLADREDPAAELVVVGWAG